MLSGAKHLPVKISFLAAPFMTTRPERRFTFLNYTTLAITTFAHSGLCAEPLKGELLGYQLRRLASGAVRTIC
jgi:hypothetical protein